MAGEIAEQSKACSVLIEDTISVPSTHIKQHMTLNSSSRRIWYFWLSWVPVCECSCFPCSTQCVCLSVCLSFTHTQESQGYTGKLSWKNKTNQHFFFFKRHKYKKSYRLRKNLQIWQGLVSRILCVCMCVRAHVHVCILQGTLTMHI